MTAGIRSREAAAERLSGRLLIGLTYLAVGALALGVLGMAAAGISPLAGGPTLDLATLAHDLVAFDPAALLWLGSILVIVTPVGRVIVAGVAFATEGDWRMVAVSIAIIAIIGLGVVTALTVTV